MQNADKREEIQMNKRFETIQSKRLTIAAFDMKYLEDYYHGFDKEITKYQYPDPFDSLESARKCLQEFLDAMAHGEMLFFAILDNDGTFVGSLEVHGLTEKTPELGIWITKDQQGKGYAYEALACVLAKFKQSRPDTWYVYEADIRNAPSMKLVSRFKFQKKEIDEFTTESGKELKLQQYFVQL